MSVQSEKLEHIGNVVVRHVRAGQDEDAPVYSDGLAENQLYAKLRENPNYSAARNGTPWPSWVEEYHLSPRRLNLLSWFPFDAKGTALEIGAGCGALTGLLCRRLSRVVAVEYSRQRALITAQRHAQCSNLEVVVGGLQDFVTDEKFDYISVIGVLEYAGTYYGGADPYKSFLVKLRDMLRPNGVLILAIENKIGLKYLCGAQEDHTGRVFDSIYDYPHPGKVRTFNKKELSALLCEAGLPHMEWYYPLPDYKLPVQVISDDCAVAYTDSIWSLLPARTAWRRRKQIISERRLGRTLMQAGLFGEFANSFLIFARRAEARQEPRCIRFIGEDAAGAGRFRSSRQICEDSNGRISVRKTGGKDAAATLGEIGKREALARNYLGDLVEVAVGRQEGDSLVYPYKPLPTMVELMAEEIMNGDLESGKRWLDAYVQFLSRLPAQRCIPEDFMKEAGIANDEIVNPLTCLRCGILDCIPRNILVDGKAGKWHVVENELTYNFAVPMDFLVWRAMETCVADLQEHIQARVSNKRPVVLFNGHGRTRKYMPLVWLDILKAAEISPGQLARWSSMWESRIAHEPRATRLRLKPKPRALTRVSLPDVRSYEDMIDIAHKCVRKIGRLFQ